MPASRRSSSSAATLGTVAEVMAKTGLKNVITVGVGDASGDAAEPAGRCTDRRVAWPRRRPGGGLPLHAGGVTGDDLFSCGTPAARPAVQGRAVAPKPRRQHRAVQGLMPVVGERARPGDRDGDPAVPHLRADGELLTFSSVGAENWLVANPRDFDGFIDTMKAAGRRCSWASTRCTPGWWRIPQQGDRLVAPEARRRRRRRRDRARCPTAGRR